MTSPLKNALHHLENRLNGDHILMMRSEEFCLKDAIEEAGKKKFDSRKKLKVLTNSLS